MARILIVEDDESVRTLAARALERAGHSTVLAADGTAGLDAIRSANGQFDLVISDVRMPMMNGLDMARAAAAIDPSIRVMLITGYVDQHEQESDLLGIVCDVLQKPFSLAEIRERVERLLTPDKLAKAS